MSTNVQGHADCIHNELIPQLSLQKTTNVAFRSHVLFTYNTVLVLKRVPFLHELSGKHNTHREKAGQKARPSSSDKGH